MNNYKGYIYSGFMFLCRLFPIRNKVVFQSFDGKNQGDNPRAIYEELRRSHVHSRYIWIVNDPVKQQVEGAQCVGRFSLRSLFHLATARVWVDNSRKRDWVIKRRGQYYIQTWHGGIALKKIEKDAAETLPVDYIRNAIHDSKLIDLLLSGSRWNTVNYRKAFWYNGVIYECGLPRSDVYFKDPRMERDKIISFFHLNKDDRLALYAPTFRNDGEMKCYLKDYDRVLAALNAKWGGNWRIIVRLHPNIQTKKDMIPFTDTVLDGSAYPDISTEIIASDLMITDYSSCMFDAMNIRKKVIIYAEDLEAYLTDRGLYFSFDDLPFPFADSSEKLIKAILEYCEEDYRYNVERFVAQYPIFDDGHSSERVVAVIKKMLENKLNQEGLMMYGEK